jgi:hypothetical protein
MLRKLFSKSLLTLMLLVAAFFAGFFAQPVSACSRINATCTYDVKGYYCSSSACSSCGGCCYIEYGRCLDDPLSTSYSTICGGLCGSRPAPGE